ncbi:MAG: c-type cytochrome biogenesis protein CcmI [Glaciecola sp.]
MNIFWLAAVLMLVVVLILLFYPVWKKKQRAHHDAFVLSNTNLIKQRLAELDEEFAQGVISAKHKEQAQKELKLALIDEQYTQAEHVKKQQGVYILVFVVALVVGGALYQHVSQLDKVQRLAETQARIKDLTDKIIVGNGEQVTPQDLFDFALAIRSRISQNPEDATGWMLLGRIYSSLQQTEQSFEAFEKALALAPDSIEILSSYAQALMVPNEIDALRRAKQVLAQWLVLEPDSNNAALMMSLTASQLNDLATTKRYYAKIVDLLPENNPAIVQIRTKIEELEGRVAAGTADKPTGFLVTITATDPILQALAAENQLNPTVLFVFARASNSDNRMPVAVRKMELTKLPLQVRLTEQDAMLANYTLNNVDAVDLVVRLSFDDVVQTKIGEYEGSITVPVIPTTITNHTIIVDKEIK